MHGNKWKALRGKRAHRKDTTKGKVAAWFNLVETIQTGKIKNG